jgi:hypothetical protein
MHTHARLPHVKKKKERKNGREYKHTVNVKALDWFDQVWATGGRPWGARPQRCHDSMRACLARAHTANPKRAAHGPWRARTGSTAHCVRPSPRSRERERRTGHRPIERQARSARFCFRCAPCHSHASSRSVAAWRGASAGATPPACRCSGVFTRAGAPQGGGG